MRLNLFVGIMSKKQKRKNRKLNINEKRVNRIAVFYDVF